MDFGAAARLFCERIWRTGFARGPARLAGLAGRKGAIASGCDADFVIWNPDAKFRVDAGALASPPQTDALRRTRAARSGERDFSARSQDFRAREFSAGPTGHFAARRRHERFQKILNLASERLGARVIAANDDFFAPKENLLKDSKPIFIEGKYTDRGKWMDGWETRRRRTPGHDWCIVRWGCPELFAA